MIDLSAMSKYDEKSLRRGRGTANHIHRKLFDQNLTCYSLTTCGLFIFLRNSAMTFLIDASGMQLENLF